ncbi:MAG: ABC transporter substrate-binding protein [Halomonas sp.]|nr:ProQ/FINO family protein [Halomonas sp.]MBP5980618.1 ABC transporter substrate-binding protein [Halomonas sp.]
MTASVMHLLDSLESRLEQAQAELQNLRSENAQLKQQLVEQAVALQKTLDEPRVPAQETPAPEAQPATPEANATEQVAFEPIDSMQAQKAPEQEVVPQAAVAEQPSPHSLLKEWYQRYPQAFFKGHTKPLKIGIHQDLATREPWSGKLIRRTLANYVNLPRYLKSVREGVDRIDLDGQPAGKVDKEASLHANEKRKEKQGEVSLKSTRVLAEKKHLEEKANLPDVQEKREFQAPRQVKDQKIEQEKPQSLGDKLKGLQQKFEGR